MLHDFSSVLSAVLLLYFGYGTVNPSGKLAETFPRKLSDTPAYLSFPGERETSVYTEGVFVGYRYYDTKEADVLFSFGHGLSYTTFAYSDLRLSHSIVREGEDVQVTVTVTNTGAVSGKETVQLYVTPPKSERHRPVGAAIIGPILQRMASAAGGATGKKDDDASSMSMMSGIQLNTLVDFHILTEEQLNGILSQINQA